MRMGPNWARQQATGVPGARPKDVSQDNPPAGPQARAVSDEPAALSEDDRSKDAFFAELGSVVEAMRARHGKDFTVGTLLLAARFVVEDKILSSTKT